MKHLSKSLVLLALGTAMSASAAPIFSDNFDRGVSNTVGNGWSEVESDAVDVSLVNRSTGGQMMQVRDDDPIAIASQLAGISTLGYSSVTLSYEWAPTNNTERGDFLWVEWRDGSLGGSWTAIASHELMGPADFSSASWDIAAGGLADFEFRFRVAVDSNNEGAYIDNVGLVGNGGQNDQRNNVPEPGSLSLAGLGLGLAAFLGRRRATAPRR
jgi:hypothetical protein